MKLLNENATQEEVDFANAIIKDEFGSKVDLAGKPYIEHLYRVAGNFSNANLICVGLLHDLLEDCQEWDEDELRLWFPAIVVDAIVAITKTKGEDYEHYIAKVSSNKMATMIKIRDLEDNMDVRRLKAITDEDVERLRKYLCAWKILTERLENSTKTQ